MGGNTIRTLTQAQMHKQFPFAEMLQNQILGFEKIAQHNGTVLLEAPTGTGKTAIGYSFLKAIAKKGTADGRCVYVTPNKTLVQQIKEQHPDVEIAFGKNEFPCLYYGGTENADAVPCSLLVLSGKCGHYVDQETGVARDPACEKCPYYEQTYNAKRSKKILVCTTAFYLFTFLFNKDKWGDASAVVFDEAHAIANTIRHLLSYEISDYRIARAITLLERIQSDQLKALVSFSKTMQRIVKNHAEDDNKIFDVSEIKQLVEKLECVNADKMRSDISTALRLNLVNPRQEMETLKHIEKLALDLRRYIRTFEFALPYGEKQKPLAYAYAHSASEQEAGKVRDKIVVRSYYVHGIIRALYGKRTVAYSATIGDPEAFKMDTGIDFPFYSLPESFPADNTRIYAPTDTPNLAQKKVKRGQRARLLRCIAKVCGAFIHSGARSLFIAPSNEECNQFLKLSAEESLRALTYGNGIPAREAARLFKAGEGDVLVGTTAQYSQGVDLPNQIAPIIFSLRPDYPNPNDPMAQFEYERFGQGVWRLWRWRVMINALQLRGRNIRGKDDIGVSFFCSAQYGEFLFSALPDYLKPAYRGDWTFAECVADAQQLLGKK